MPHTLDNVAIGRRHAIPKATPSVAVPHRSLQSIIAPTFNPTLLSIDGGNIEMSFAIHPQAASGFYAAVSYDTHRPNYSPLSVDSLLLELGVRGVREARIVELGAGTGKFTELLASRPEQYEIVAGEPHDQMRGVLDNKNLARTTVVADLAENLANVEDGWADAVIVAQAFHWFATINTLREIRRVLRPVGAGLGLIWNVDDFNAPIEHTPSTPYEARLKSIIRSLPNPINLYRELRWKDSLHYEHQKLFQYPLKEGEVAYNAVLSKESIWERFATMSQVSKLGETERQTLRDRVFDALAGEDVEVTVDGNIEYHGRTVWYWTFPTVVVR